MSWLVRQASEGGHARPVGSSSPLPATVPSPQAGIGRDGLPEALNQVVGTAASAFEAPLTPEAFERLVDGVVDADPQALAHTAFALGRALGLPNPLPQPPDAALNRTRDALRARPLPCLPASDLLVLLRAAADRPQAFGLSAAALEAWQACFWTATRAHAAADPHYARLLVPRLRSVIGRSPLFLELQGRPDVLLQTLRYLYGGAAGAHSVDCRALCEDLRATLADRDGVVQCLRDLLLEALLACTRADSREAAMLRDRFTEARVLHDRGVLPSATFRSAMEHALDKLEPITHACALSPERAAVRKALAGLGMASPVREMPAELRPDPDSTDTWALTYARRLYALCAEHGHQPFEAWKGEVTGYLRSLLRHSPAHDWTPDDAATRPPLGEMLLVLRRGVWLLRYATPRAVGVTGLPREVCAQVVAAVDATVDEWLTTRPWHGALDAGGGCDLLRRILVRHWCKVLQCWVLEPQSRTALLEPASLLLLPGPLPDAVHRLLGGVRPAMEIFGRCMSAFAVEGAARARLAAALVAQLDPALQQPEGGVEPVLSEPR